MLGLQPSYFPNQVLGNGQGNIKMAFAATVTAFEPRSHSIGPWKVQYFTWTCASGDTSGTITATRLSSARHCELIGLTQTALPTYSGNVVTVAFADPVATVFGQARVLGV